VYFYSFNPPLYSLLIITLFLYTTTSFSCGALNGKGLECDLVDKGYVEDNNFFLNIFFLF